MRKMNIWRLNRIFPQVIFILLVLIPIFKPASFETYNLLNKIVKILKLVSIITMFIYAFFNMCTYGFRKRFILPVFSLGLFWFIYIINSIRNHSIDESLVVNAVVSVLIVIDIYYMASKKEMLYLIKAIDILFTVWTFLQILSIFIISESKAFFGMTGNGLNYFLGLDNYSAFAILPMLGILIYLDMLIYKRIRLKEKLFTITAILSYLYVKSATAVFAFLIFSILLFMQNRWKKILKYITVKHVAMCLIILWGLIYFFDIQNIFASFLTSKFLGKGEYYYGITLNSRTIIWQFAVDLIKIKPILGYGDLTGQQISDYALYGMDHCHNIFLEILLRAGLIGFICYFLFMLIPFKTNKGKLSKVTYRVLFITTISLLVLSFMDYYPQMQYFYLLFSLVYFDDYIEKGIKKFKGKHVIEV